MSESPTPVGADREPHRRLDSWKEIAAHLNRTVRTVQRWERDEGLPILRLDHQKQASIYAYADELDAWWAKRSAATDSMPEPKGPPAVELIDLKPSLSRSTRPHMSWLAAAGLAALLIVGSIFSGSVSRVIGRSRADTLYAQGREAWNQRTPDGFHKAQASFESAIVIDPQHARAHSGLADTYSLLWGFGLMSRDAALPRAREEAMRALAIEPDLAEAHASLSYVMWEENDHAGAEAEAQRAIALDPNYPTARHWYALYLQATKRIEDAIVQASTAVKLDPSSPILATDLSIMLRGAGQLDEAEAVLDRARYHHPDFPDIYVQLATIRIARGRDAEALPFVKRAIELGDHRPRIVAMLGCLEVRSGNLAGASHALAQLRERASGEYIPDDVEIVLQGLNGQIDAAYQGLERAYAKREAWLMDVPIQPCFEPIRRDPKWPGFEARLLSDDAWRVTPKQP